MGSLLPAAETDEAIARLWSVCPSEMEAVVARYEGLVAFETGKILRGENGDYETGACGRLADVVNELRGALERALEARTKARKDDDYRSF